MCGACLVGGRTLSGDVGGVKDCEADGDGLERGEDRDEWEGKWVCGF